MKRADAFREVSLRQAALWLGCSPNFILKMRRHGWLKTVEDIEKKATTSNPTYYLWTLHVLAWDIANGLSFYDILAIRKSQAAEKVIAHRGGIPVRVVSLVREAYIFGWLVLLLERYSGRRTYKQIDNVDVELPFPPDPFTLPKLLSELSARDRAASCLGSASPSRTQSGKASFSHGHIETPFAKKLFSRQGLARQTDPEQQQKSEMWAQIQATKELHEAFPLLRGHPTEPLCQIESEPEDK